MTKKQLRVRYPFMIWLWVLFITVTFASWFTFLFDAATVRGTKDNVQVQSYAQTEPLLQEINELAIANNTLIAVYTDQSNERIIYATGGSADSWIKNGFHQLPGTSPSTVRPLTELPQQDARQTFVFECSPQFKAQLLQLLNTKNVHYQELAVLEWEYLFKNPEVRSIFFVSVLLSLVLVFLGTVAATRLAAIRALHGWGVLRMFTADFLQQVLRRWWLFVLIPFGTAVFFGYYSPSLAWSFGRYFFILLFVIGLPVVAVQLLLLKILGLVSIPQRIAGKLPYKVLISAALLVQVGLLLITANSINGLLNQTQELNRREAVAQLWQGRDHVYAFEINGARDFEGNTTSTQQLAQLLNEQDTQGNLIYSHTLFPGDSPEPALATGLITYNEQAAQLALAPATLASIPSQDQRIKILVPAGWQNHNYELAKLHPACPENCDVIEQDSSYQAFTWQGYNFDFADPLSLTNPVVVILPHQFLPEPRNLVAAFTQNRAGLTSLEILDQVRDHPDLASYLQYAGTLAGNWDQGLASLKSLRQINSFALLVSIIINLVLALFLAVLLRQALATRQRVLRIHGFFGWRYAALPMIFGLGSAAILGLHLWRLGAAVRYWQASPHGVAVNPAMLAMFNVSPATWGYSFCLVVVVSAITAAATLRPQKLER